MAFSTQRATSDGTLVQLAISIDYFDRTEISVLFNGILSPIGAGKWSWVGTTEKKINFTPTVANGVEVTVLRSTRLGSLLHEYTKGAQFIAETLDENFNQALRIAQEAKEGGGASEIFSDVDHHGYRIKNVGAAILPTDAVSLGQYQADAAGAGAAATAAGTSATNAAASAAAALASKNAAATSETNAGTSATNASNSATAANTSAGNAAGSATAANTSAGNAATSATNAGTSETNALGYRNAAQTAAASVVRDGSGGVAGLTGFALNLYNAAATIKSALVSVATAIRTWTFPDKSGTVALTQDLPGRNRFINGDMRIDQRWVGTALTCPAGTANYTVDQWLMLNARTNGTTVIAQRDTADVPAGFAYCLKLTNTSTGASVAGDSIHIGQALEGFNVADMDYGKATAKAATIQFWAKASAGGNYAVGLRNANSTRSYVQHVALTANTWTYVTLTIPGDTSGTWLVDNNVGVYFVIDLGMGSTYTTATVGSWQAGAFLGTTTSVKPFLTAGATFRLTGAQFEAGSLATPFEIRSVDDEYYRCIRYFRKTFPSSVVPANATGNTGGALFMSPYAYAGYHGVRWEYGQMRIVPTITTYNVYAGTAGYWTNPSSTTNSAAGTIGPGDASVFMAYNGAGSATPASGDAMYLHATASAVM